MTYGDFGTLSVSVKAAKHEPCCFTGHEVGNFTIAHGHKRILIQPSLLTRACRKRNGHSYDEILCLWPPSFEIELAHLLDDMQLESNENKQTSLALRPSVQNYD